MQIGITGLGRMGMNMARRLIKNGHEVVAHNRSPQKAEQIQYEGAIAAFSPEELVKKLIKPRIVWMMLPAEIVDASIEIYEKILESGDILIDGGNTNFRDDIRRAEQLKKKGICYFDAGVSGGVWGLTEGYCIMTGGDEEVFKHIEPLLQSLAPENGYLHCGAHGAGHYVKMVHNGIEYAMMEAYGEGFEMIKASPYGEGINMAKVAHMWNHGSVIRSWLLELIASSFEKDPELHSIQGYVEDSGEGRWSVIEAVNSGVAAPVIAQSLFKRFQSRQADVFSDKVVAAMRREFGGHAVAKKGEDLRSSAAGVGEVSAARADEKYRG